MPFKVISTLVIQTKLYCEFEVVGFLCLKRILSHIIAKIKHMFEIAKFVVSAVKFCMWNIDNNSKRVNDIKRFVTNEFI